MQSHEYNTTANHTIIILTETLEKILYLSGHMEIHAYIIVNEDINIQITSIITEAPKRCHNMQHRL